ncbi:4Fe-4S dicluster domain-containing protein [Clostridium sp. MSJ-4]|uniref:4Fe-4S dicluster domain-containing protein n=1 Tax=Clostridium simiarum TaxID=2841506 RepID=A0ABS6EYU7_9CLOT|nr:MULTISPECIES: 4Fe-4S dicluster domain-containing protein [Clostridium]MBU5590542.1 4Fe-4S dicluster domain-containing protein [Clostridium simiarum]
MSKLNILYEMNKVKKKYIRQDAESILELISKDEEDQSISQEKRKPLSKEEFINLLKENHIKEINSLKDSYLKYEQINKEIDVLVINALDNDPAVRLNKVLLDNYVKEIQGSLDTICNIFNVKKLVIVSEEGLKDKSEKILSNTSNKNMEILPNHYGWLGDDFLKEKLNLQNQNSVVVESLLDLYYIYQLINFNKITNFLINIDGGAVNKKGVFTIAKESTYKEIVDALGGFNKEPYKIISGGILKGQGIFQLDDQIKSGDFSLLFLTEKESPSYKEEVCIRCGNCIDICPKKLVPMKLKDYAIERNFDRFKKAKGLDCINCGLCSYVCPSKRHLVQSINTAKNIILDTK